MITRTESWKNALAQAIRDPRELCDLLDLPRELLGPAHRAAGAFPLRVPRAYVERMCPGDPADPLLRQVLPLGEELETVPGYAADPVGDLAARRAPALLHKYRGRALLVTTGACAVHCRYCFRRHFPYAREGAGHEGRRAALAHVAADPAIEEVILSGGDPLLLDDERLAELAAALADMPHVQRLRVHTRLPVVLPERVNEALVGWLTATRLAPVVVIHANHARELAGAVPAALARLRAAGVTLLNQTVLLRGVNDSEEAQCALAQRLFALGVLPYYLHLLDRVAGAAHFDVAPERAAAIIDGMRRRLSGYLMPRPVREVAGEAYKVPVGDGWR